MNTSVNNTFFFLFWLLFSLQIQTILPLTTTTYGIKDLEASSFLSDILNWSAPDRVTTNTYGSCLGTLLFGGPAILGTTYYNQLNTYIQRNYNNLPPHNMINFQFNFWAMGYWSGYTYEINFDGVALGGWWLTYSNYMYYTSSGSCGGHDRYLSYTVYGRVVHSAPTLTFRIYSRLQYGSYYESFGIRDFQLLFDGTTSPSNYLCGYSPISLPSSNCACSTGYCGCHANCATCWGPGANQCFSCKNTARHFYDGYQCQVCHSYCATCFGTASNECTSCMSGYYYFSWARQCLPRCDYPLTVSGSTCVSPCSASSFIYWDGSCGSTCPPPFQQTTLLSVIKLCINPCSPVEFLYWDGSCQQDCPSPMIITENKKVKLCQNNCSPPSFRSFIGSCATTCNPPLVKKIQNMRYLCLEPCPFGQYVYSNGDCTDTCSPLLTPTTISGVRTCVYPCSNTQFLYWDGSCKNNCPYPLHTRTEREKKYCDYPTDPANYLYWDGTEAANCITPTSRFEMSRYFCDYACNIMDYLYWDGLCEPECLFPRTQRVQHGRQFCDFVCSGATPFLNWDGSCIGSCSSPPLTIRIEKGQSFCEYPCEKEEFLYWEGSCEKSCPSLLTTRIEGTSMLRNFCDFPCSGLSPYLYANGTCLSTCTNPAFVTEPEHDQFYCNFICPDGKFLYYNGSCLPFCFSPFVPSVFGVEKYCNLPCSSSSEFYYWNDTCISSCDMPLQQYVTGDIKWCLFPCLVNQFLHINQSCSDTCDSPLSIKEEAGQKYCLNPCSPTTEYLYWDGSCSVECDLPLRNQTLNFGKVCLLPCENPTDYYYELEAVCKPGCETPSLDHNDIYLRCFPPKFIINYGTIMDIILEAETSQEKPTLVAPVKMLNYIKYIDMELPPRLEKFIISQGRNILSLRFGSSMTGNMAKAFVKKPLPAAFERRRVHSSFLVNFWGEIMTWVIMLGAAMIFQILEAIFTLGNMPNLKAIFKRLRVMTKWNFLLLLVATSVGDIILFSFLEFKSFDGFGFTFSGLSFETSLAGIILIFVLGYGILYVVKMSQVLFYRVQPGKNNEEYERFLAKWKGYQIFYKGFNNKVAPNHLFFLLYLIRMAFPMLISAYFYYSSLTQVIIYVLFSFLTLAYIIKKKPLTKKINYLQLLIVESIVLVINLSLFALKLLEMTRTQWTQAGAVLGDIVICGNASINIILLVFLVIKIYQGLKAIYFYQIKQPVKQNTLWLQILTYVFQQGGMGFEEMYIDLTAAKILNQPRFLIQETNDVNELDIMLKGQSKFVNSNERKLSDENPLNSMTNRPKDDLLSFRPSKDAIHEATIHQINPHPIRNIQEEDPLDVSQNPRRTELDSTMKLLNEISFVGLGYSGTPLDDQNQLLGESFSLAKYLKPELKYQNDEKIFSIDDENLIRKRSNEIIIEEDEGSISRRSKEVIFEEIEPKRQEDKPNERVHRYLNESEPPTKRNQMRDEDNLKDNYE